MPKCGKFGAASTAGWGAGAAIFSPVGRVVLLQGGGCRRIRTLGSHFRVNFLQDRTEKW
jgi:hypothetical protein